MRAGLHTGECALLDGKVDGVAVHIGARMGKEAVKDLVAGSGIAFARRRIAELKALPGEWSLFSVEGG